MNSEIGSSANQGAATRAGEGEAGAGGGTGSSVEVARHS